MAYAFVDHNELDQCAWQIADRFKRDVVSRAEHAGLPDGCYASGQYFDQPTRNQRGLHGTAAALRVLGVEAERDPESRTFAAGIVRYLESRDRIEADIAHRVMAARGSDDEHLQDEEWLWADKLRHDRRHTVKQAELLHALAFKHGVVPADKLRNDVIGRLQDSRSQDGKGWAFVLDRKESAHELPTAYVLRALHANGHTVEPWSTNLAQNVRSRAGMWRTTRDAEADCFKLLVLLELSTLTARDARPIFDPLWSYLDARMRERNQTHWNLYDGSRQNHVFVPWQLHLLVLAALVRPYRCFARPDAQAYLRSVIENVNGGEPVNADYDDEAVSTRSYGYVYDAIRALRARPLAPTDTAANRLIARAADVQEGVARLFWATVALGIAAILGWGTYLLITRPQSRLAGIALNAVATVLTAAFLFAFRRVRRAKGRVN